MSEEGSGADNDDDFGGVGSARQKSMDEILADSSDDDLDLEEEETSKTKGKKKKGSGTWIQEGEEILDLLSSTAAQSISSTKPSQAATANPATAAEKKRVRKSDFKMTADGKIIITDKVGKNDDDEDDNDDDVEYSEKPGKTDDGYVMNRENHVFLKRFLNAEIFLKRNGRIKNIMQSPIK